MNLKILERELTKLKIREDYYCLTGGLPNESLTINKLGNGVWEVYYSERGNKSNLQRFSTEAEACQNLYERLLDDEVVMSDLEE